MTLFPAQAAVLRRMHHEDLSAVSAVQASAYPAFFLEDDATLRARLTTCADTAWVAQGAQGVCAYLVAYRCLPGRVTPLGAQFAPPPGANGLYLHDLAVSAAAAGQGLGPQLVRHALAQARSEGLAFSALVSVQGSEAFWHRLGYQVQVLEDVQQRAHLASYPGQAVYMRQALAGA
jgi:ribosomal protein S18 acetylase RimI-like enzyme